MTATYRHILFMFFLKQATLCIGALPWDAPTSMDIFGGTVLLKKQTGRL